MQKTRNIIYLFVIIAVAAAIVVLPTYLKNRGEASRFPIQMPDSIQLPVETEGPVFVEFYSPDCGICVSMAPRLQQLEKDYTGKVQFVQLNTDQPENAQFISDFQVTGLPTFFWIDKDRRITAQEVGDVPDEVIIEHLEEIVP